LQVYKMNATSGAFIY